VADQREYTIRLTWRGLVVLVRYRRPGLIPGDFEWGRWRRTGLDEQRDVLERLTHA
jgi:hypothetical protein